MAKSIDIGVGAAGELTRFEVSLETATALGLASQTSFATNAILLPNGNFSIPVTEDVKARLDRLRRVGESDSDVIQRVFEGKDDERFAQALKAALAPEPAKAKAPPGRKFATLFEDFRASLADTNRMKPYYPVDALDGTQRPVFDRACRDLLPVMHRAHRVVLEDDFTELAGRLQELSPAHLLAASATARLPYETLWVEWNQHQREITTSVIDTGDGKPFVSQAGLLIAPYGGRYRAIIAAKTGDAAVPNMIGFSFDLREPWVDWSNLKNEGDLPWDEALFADVPGAVEALRTAPWGPGYGEWKGQQRPALDRFLRHAFYHPAPPLGLLMWSTIRNALDAGENEVLERQRSWFLENVMATRSLYRWLVAVLALLAHLPDTEVDKRPVKAPGGLSRGRIMPGYHYHVVTLRRPLNARRIGAAILRDTPPAPRALHDVVGAWHYRHGRGDPNCPHVWERRLDADGNPVGKDQQVCKKCTRLRWRVKDHKRGDERYGVIEKGHRVVSAPPPEAESHVR